MPMTNAKIAVMLIAQADWFDSLKNCDPKLLREGDNERPPELQPTIDAAEAFLLAVFVRRYVTYCARRGKYAAKNGA